MTPRLLLHLGFRVQQGARQDPRGAAGHQEPKASGLYFCVPGGPWSSGPDSRAEASGSVPRKPITGPPQKPGPRMLGRAGEGVGKRLINMNSFPAAHCVTGLWESGVWVLEHF